MLLLTHISPMLSINLCFHACISRGSKVHSACFTSLSCFACAISAKNVAIEPATHTTYLLCFFYYLKWFVGLLLELDFLVRLSIFNK